MTGGLGRTTNAEEMITAEEGMTEGLGRAIEKIGDGDSCEKTSHRMTERQRKFLQANELQMLYRRGAK